MTAKPLQMALLNSAEVTALLTTKAAIGGQKGNGLKIEIHFVQLLWVKFDKVISYEKLGSLNHIIPMANSMIFDDVGCHK